MSLPEKCAHCTRKPIPVRVRRREPDLASEDNPFYGDADVDACIAPLVVALNAAGLGTVSSCCGHGGRPASIVLHDGREVIVFEGRAPWGYISCGKKGGPGKAPKGAAPGSPPSGTYALVRLPEGGEEESPT